MKNNTLKIEKAENGYIITTYIWMDDDEKGNRIYQENKELVVGDDNLKDLLERIAEWSGYLYDKFGTNNINITFDKKGHKL